jgi:hypothetical protein
MARFVAVIEMIGLGIVEIDGLLDEAKPKDSRVERDVAARRARNRRNVVDAALTHRRALRRASVARVAVDRFRLEALDAAGLD